MPAQGIDTSEGNPAGKLQLHILCAVAEFEHEIIRERVNPVGQCFGNAEAYSHTRSRYNATVSGQVE